LIRLTEDALAALTQESGSGMAAEQSAVVWWEHMGGGLLKRGLGVRALLFCVILPFAAGGSSPPACPERSRGASAGTERIVFKRQATAILKMDGKPVKFWEVYVAEKRGHLVLVQLGRRYLLLDTKEKDVLEIEPGAIQQKPKGNDVAWTRSPQNEKKIVSEEWSLRKIGPAIAIQVRLSAEGRLLEIQLPRMPDSGWIF
jgi:hypothetical protein